MASRVLYAPVVASYMPAFRADGERAFCRVYFSLSKFNSLSDFNNVQVAIMKQGNGMTVVNPINRDGRFRSNGKVILNVIPVEVEDKSNLYFFDLKQEDIKNGQTPGQVYKIQLRLSNATYVEKISEGEETIGQDDQMAKNSSEFSEQSTVCVTKALGQIGIEVNSPFDYDSYDPDAETEEAIANSTVESESESEEESESVSDEVKIFPTSTIQFAGRMKSADPSEKLYSWRLQLYNGTDDSLTELLEDTGEITSNQYQNQNEFNYLFKREFMDGSSYTTVFHYTTINGWEDEYKCKFKISYAEGQSTKFAVYTVESVEYQEEHYHKVNTAFKSPGNAGDNDNVRENVPDYDFSDITGEASKLTSLMQEEEEGRVGLKIVLPGESGTQSGNICIRRTDERSNFEEWEDIKIIVVKQQIIDTLPIVYDYTIESGIYYKYGIQEIDRGGWRSLTNRMPTNVMRDFQYSFLLGENNQQLKLKFDNTMQSFKIQQSESKIEPIGSKYPTITRNAAIEYRTFPIAGLISFQMDDNKLFCTKEDIYKEPYTENGLHKHIISIGGINYETYPDYDFTQERDFRKEVLKFLHNGKPKLFKSPTEGNIIVRLMDINCTPNQTLDRMIYSFTSNANEIAEATMENYLKYNFYEVGEYAESFAQTETKIGQLDMTFNCPYPGSKGSNILKEIQNKYTGGNENVAGWTRKIQKVYQIQITIQDKPLRVLAPGYGAPTNEKSLNSFVVGNNLSIEGQGQSNTKVIIYNGIYDFDSRIVFTNPNSQALYLLGDYEQENSEGKSGIGTVNATIDFLYEIVSEPYLGKIKESITTSKGIGQIYQTFTPDYHILSEILRRHDVSDDRRFNDINSIWGIEIEAKPGCIFKIQDDADDNPQEHVINSTGILRLFNISAISRIDFIGKVDGSTTPEDIMVTYYYNYEKGTYRKNE